MNYCALQPHTVPYNTALHQSSRFSIYSWTAQPEPAQSQHSTDWERYTVQEAKFSHKYVHFIPTVPKASESGTFDT